MCATSTDKVEGTERKVIPYERKSIEKSYLYLVSPHVHNGLPFPFGKLDNPFINVGDEWIAFCHLVHRKYQPKTGLYPLQRAGNNDCSLPLLILDLYIYSFIPVPLDWDKSSISPSCRLFGCLYFL